MENPVKRKKKGKKKEKEKKNRKQERGNYPFFVSLFIIGPYDSQKKNPQKMGKNF